VAKKIRDSQRQKLYDAEDAAFGKEKPPEFRTIAECQAYVDRVVGSEAWEALGFSHLGMFDSHPLTVKDGRGRRRGGRRRLATLSRCQGRRALFTTYCMNSLTSLLPTSTTSTMTRMTRTGAAGRAKRTPRPE
jgi:hypothetical protein